MMGFGLLFLLIVIGGIYYLTVSDGKQPQKWLGGDDPPGQILDRRYARGEIARDEYQQAKKDLKS